MKFVAIALCALVMTACAQNRTYPTPSTEKLDYRNRYPYNQYQDFKNFQQRDNNSVNSLFDTQ